MLFFICYHTKESPSRCAVQIRGPYNPKRARSKMVYPANTIGSTRTFRVGIGRFPDISRPPPDRCHPLRKSFLWIATNFFWHLPFFKFPETLKKGALVSNPHFTRRFGPEAGPASTREHFHSMRKVIPDISILCPKSFHFREKCELENSKNFIRLLSKSSVFQLTENSSDTWNLLKSDICDLQQLRGLETAASGLLARL